jgi:hypothetical protein
LAPGINQEDHSRGRFSRTKNIHEVGTSWYNLAVQMLALDRSAGNWDTASPAIRAVADLHGRANRAAECEEVSQSRWRRERLHYARFTLGYLGWVVVVLELDVRKEAEAKLPWYLT